MINSSENSFTVIIPYFRNKKTILKTLESVSQQTLAPYETIIIDDGSLDSFLPTLKSYFNFTLVSSNENKGTALSRTIATKLARSDYIALLDADDLWLPNHLEIHKSLWDRVDANTACVGTSMYLFQEELPKTTEAKGKLQKSHLVRISPLNLAFQNVFFNSATTFSLSKLQQIGFWINSTPSYCEDYSLLFSFLKSDFHLYFSTMKTGYYRISDSSKSSNIALIFESKCLVISDFFDSTYSWSIVKRNLKKLYIFNIWLSSVKTMLNRELPYSTLTSRHSNNSLLFRFFDLFFQNKFIWSTLSLLNRYFFKRIKTRLTLAFSHFNKKHFT